MSEKHMLLIDAVAQNASLVPMESSRTLLNQVDELIGNNCTFSRDALTIVVQDLAHVFMADGTIHKRMPDIRAGFIYEYYVGEKKTHKVFLNNVAIITYNPMGEIINPLLSPDEIIKSIAWLKREQACNFIINMFGQ